MALCDELWTLHLFSVRRLEWSNAAGERMYYSVISRVFHVFPGQLKYVRASVLFTNLRGQFIWWHSIMILSGILAEIVSLLFFIFDARRFHVELKFRNSFLRYSRAFDHRSMIW